MLLQNATPFAAEEMIGDIRRTAPGTQLSVDHQHPVLELNLVLRGTGRYELQDTTLSLRPGALVWIAPGRRHRLVRSTHLEMWVIAVRADVVDPAWHALVQAQPVHQVESRDLVELDRLFSEVAQDSDDLATYNAGIIYAVRRAQRATQTDHRAAREVHPAVARALLLMRETDGRLALPEVAQHTGVVASYLSRLFVLHTHRTFVEWRNRIRLMRFMHRFQQGDTLLSAAEDAGFGSYAQFHRVFLDLVGCSPRQWQRERAQSSDPDPTGLSASLDAYLRPLPGLPHRQRWSGLVPRSAPLLSECLGEDFITRMCLPSRELASDAESEQDLNTEAIVHALRAHQPGGAEPLVELARAQDFGSLYALLLGFFDLSPRRLPDAIAAYLCLLWVVVTQAPTPSTTALQAVVRQVRGALRVRPSGAVRRDLHALLACYAIVLARSVEAVRAAADPASQAHLGEAAHSLARATLGPGLATLRLTEQGFEPLEGLSGRRGAVPAIAP
ncbi:MAG TPA: AraC family transcriptional regulator [Stenotrophomonas sp.]